jgi:hypothetical protein
MDRQYHMPSKLRHQTSSKSSVFLAATQGNYDVPAECFDFWDRVEADPYYEEVVAKDEAHFFNAERSIMTVGWNEVYIDDGKIVVEQIAKRSDVGTLSRNIRQQSDMRLS